MADTIAVGDIIEVIYVGNLYSQVILNTFHYEVESLGTATDYVPFSTALAAELNTGVGGLIEKFADCLATDYNFTQIRIQRIYNGRLAALGFNSDFPTGNVAEAALPPGTSVSIHRSGINAGRHNVGGIRMAAIPPSFVDEGEVSSTGRLAYEALASSFPNVITTVAIGTIVPIILNRTTPTSSPTIFSASVKNTIRTMSRRVVGRGI